MAGEPRRAMPSARVHYDPDRDAWLVHRPARTWPRKPPTGPLRVPAPPQSPEPDRGSTLGSALPMLGSLGIVAFAFVAGSLVYLVVAGVLIVAILAGAIGARLASRRRERRRRARVRRDYLFRLARAEERARHAALVQRDALLGLYPDTAGHLEAVRWHGALWERRPTDADFGTVRLGLGRTAAAAPVVPAQEETPVGGVPEADLARRAEELARASAVVDDAPVLVPLRTLSAVAVVGDLARGRDLLGAWVVALAATCAPTDLRVIGLVPEAALPAWEWCKWLPHTRDPYGGDGFARARRAVTSDREAFATAVHGLVNARAEQARLAGESRARPDADQPVRVNAEHVLVVVDGYDPEVPAPLAADLDVLLADGASLGVTVVLLVPEPAAVPSSLGARVDLLRGGRARYREAGPDGRIEDEVLADHIDRDSAEQLARLMAPLQLADVDANADIVDTVRLVELLGYDNADQLDPAVDWLTPARMSEVGAPDGQEHPGAAYDEAPVMGPTAADLLTTPIGVRSDGSRLVLDLKEAAAGGMGPHGVLVGATGSGKSELLRSLVGGLAARHDPAVLNVLLVDFKGGAAFAELAGLPHTTGLITNLADDLSLVDRMRLSLAGELERRQQLLRDAGDVESIGHYQQLRAERRHLPDLPYLLVVVDEFGELLSARPEFIETFVAIGRLGRSLGVHLLLATQRLDEGRIRGLESHLRYRICLRTYSAAESTAVIGVPVAHGLPALPGLGYLRVDADLVRFKAATASLPHQPLLPHEKAPAVVLPFDLGGQTAVARGVSESAGGSPSPNRRTRSTELSTLVRRLRDVAVTCPPPVWLPPLPAQVPLADLLDHSVARPDLSAVPVGLLDEPARQAQRALTLDLTGSGGHVACVGSPRTGKTTFLRTLVQALSEGRGPEDAAVYLLDLGGGGLHDLLPCPHVGAVVGRHDSDAVARLVREMTAMVNERAAAFRACGVTSLGQLRGHPDGPRLLPDPLASEVFLLVDNVGVLRNEFPELDLSLADLAATSLQFGVHVVVTANRWLDVRPALLDAIGTRIELRLNDPVDSLAGRLRAQTVPADRPGRGILRDGRHVQLALPSQTPRTAPAPAMRAPRVLPLPARLNVDEIPGLAAAAGRPVSASPGLVLGVGEFRLTPEIVDLTAPGAHLLVYGDEGSGRTTLLRRTFDHLAYSADQEEVQLHVVDLGRGLLDRADSPQVAHYAFARSQVDALVSDLVGLLLHRLPPPDLDRDALLNRSWWSGPEHVLLVDDYELTVAGAQSPLSALADALGHARDIGLHVVLARAVAGASRSAFEPFGQRLRELTPYALILDGERSEGPLVGDRTARRRPPGRGVLVRRGAPDTLVQLALPDEERP